MNNPGDEKGIDWYMRQVNKPAGEGGEYYSYDEFMSGYAAQELDFSVNESRALAIQAALPNSALVKATMLSWVWMLSIPILVVLAFFTYGLSLIGLFFVPMIFRAAKRATADAVLLHALLNRRFFEALMERGELLVYRKDGRAKPVSSDANRLYTPPRSGEDDTL